jgi:hypothetical protein
LERLTTTCEELQSPIRYTELTALRMLPEDPAAWIAADYC